MKLMCKFLSVCMVVLSYAGVLYADEEGSEQLDYLQKKELGIEDDLSDPEVLLGKTEKFHSFLPDLYKKIDQAKLREYIIIHFGSLEEARQKNMEVYRATENLEKLNLNSGSMDLLKDARGQRKELETELKKAKEQLLNLESLARGEEFPFPHEKKEESLSGNGDLEPGSKNTPQFFKKRFSHLYDWIRHREEILDQDRNLWMPNPIIITLPDKRNINVQKEYEALRKIVRNTESKGSERSLAISKLGLLYTQLVHSKIRMKLEIPVELSGQFISAKKVILEEILWLNQHYPNAFSNEKGIEEIAFNFLTDLMDGKMVYSFDQAISTAIHYLQTKWASDIFFVMSEIELLSGNCSQAKWLLDIALNHAKQRHDLYEDEVLKRNEHIKNVSACIEKMIHETGEKRNSRGTWKATAEILSNVFSFREKQYFIVTIMEGDATGELHLIVRDKTGDSIIDSHFIDYRQGGWWTNGMMNSFVISQNGPNLIFSSPDLLVLFDAEKDELLQVHDLTSWVKNLSELGIQPDLIKEIGSAVEKVSGSTNGNLFDVNTVIFASLYFNQDSGDDYLRYIDENTNILEAVKIIVGELKKEEENFGREEEIKFTPVMQKALHKVGPEKLLLLLETSDSKMRLFGIKALGILGASANLASDAIIKLLETDESSWNRENAIHTLRHIGADRKKVVQGLVRALKEDDADNVRRGAVEILADMQAKEAIPAVFEALGDNDNEVSEAADAVLGQFDLGASDLEMLSEIVKKCTSWEGRVKALEIIGGLADKAKPVSGTIVEALTADKDSRVRMAAAETLGKVEGKGAMKDLFEVLGDKEEVCKSAESVLDQFALSENDLGTLVEAVETCEMWKVKAKAIEMIGTLGLRAKSSAPAIINTMKVEKDWRMRAICIETLTKIETDKEKIVPVLIEALREDRAYEVREMAASALGEIGGVNTIFELFNALGDRVKFVRESAEIAIDKLTIGETDPELLIKVLSECQNWRGRRKALHIIEEMDIKAKVSISALEDVMMNDRNEENRELSKRILDELLKK